jgi:hypothetical protein
MRTVLGVATILISLGALSGSASATCNIRGEFCGYPAWAANAFSHPRDRVPNWVLEDNERVLHGVQPRKRGYYYRYYRKRR